MAPKILLVEDDINIQGFAKEVLSSLEFEVRACETAAGAMKIFASWRPDLFILDVSLPDGNGIDLCKALKQAGAEEGPFLFLTARGEMDTRLAAFKAGAQDYVQKPFGIEELVARVNVQIGANQKRQALSQKVQSLELRERLRQDLMDMVVHDMKTPLGSIRGTLELIKKQGLISDEHFKQLVVNAESAADFTIMMLNDFLDINQASQVGLKPVKEEVPVESLFVKLQALFAGRCKSKGLRLEYERPKDVVSVTSDWNLLFRVIANLISNAVKISEKGMAIELACRRHGSKTRLIVADRGPGVPDRDKVPIFEKYTSMIRNKLLVDASSGIGLAFCSTAAQALGAKIWVEDRPGGGSLFILEV